MLFRLASLLLELNILILSKYVLAPKNMFFSRLLAWTSGLSHLFMSCHFLCNLLCDKLICIWFECTMSWLQSSRQINCNTDVWLIHQCNSLISQLTNIKGVKWLNVQVQDFKSSIYYMSSFTSWALYCVFVNILACTCPCADFCVFLRIKRFGQFSCGCSPNSSRATAGVYTLSAFTQNRWSASIRSANVKQIWPISNLFAKRTALG